VKLDVKHAIQTPQGWVICPEVLVQRTATWAVYTVDLRGVDAETIEIRTKDGGYSVRARSREAVTLCVGGDPFCEVPGVSYEVEVSIPSLQSSMVFPQFDRDTDRLSFSVQCNDTTAQTGFPVPVNFTGRPRRADVPVQAMPVMAPAPKPKKEPSKMPEPKEPSLRERVAAHPVVKTVERDAADAAWRMAGHQLVKLAREPLVAALARSLGPGDETFRARLAAFLETELGATLLTALLSVGLSAVPALPGLPAPLVQRLAQELRVKSMAGAADLIVDVVMGPVRETLATFAAGGQITLMPFPVSEEDAQIPATSSATPAAFDGGARPEATETVKRRRRAD